MKVQRSTHAGMGSCKTANFVQVMNICQVSRKLPATPHSRLSTPDSRLMTPTPLSPRPALPVQTPVLDGFRQVLGFNGFAFCKICYGSGHFQDAVIGPCG